MKDPKDTPQYKYQKNIINQMCDNFEKSSKVPYMTTPDRSVEEIVEEMFQYYDDIDISETVNQSITAKEQAELWIRRIIQAERQRCEEMVGWKGYVVVDSETDYYTYSNVFFKKSEAEKKLKDFDVNGLKVIEVDVTLTQPNNPK